MVAVVTLVPAAGGVVWRPPGEIVLVHRPRYDDWTLPKGKLEKGEHPLAAAVREVGEEAGVRGAPQRRLPPVRYLTGVPGVEKFVTFWSMRCLDQSGLTAGPDEIDEVAWLPVAQAQQRLTYAHDRGIVSAFLSAPLVTGVVVLMRHGSAGSRSEWSGDDSRRPLDPSGLASAAAIASLLPVFAPERVVSATPVRCVSTVSALAEACVLAVEPDSRFDEDASPAEAASQLRRLAQQHPATVVCSQGGLIPGLMAALGFDGPRHAKPAKGTGWVLCFAGADVVSADPLDPL